MKKYNNLTVNSNLWIKRSYHKKRIRICINLIKEIYFKNLLNLNNKSIHLIYELNKTYNKKKVFCIKIKRSYQKYNNTYFNFKYLKVKVLLRSCKSNIINMQYSLFYILTSFFNPQVYFLVDF